MKQYRSRPTTRVQNNHSLCLHSQLPFRKKMSIVLKILTNQISATFLHRTACFLGRYRKEKDVLITLTAIIRTSLRFYLNAGVGHLFFYFLSFFFNFHFTEVKVYVLFIYFTNKITIVCFQSGISFENFNRREQSFKCDLVHHKKFGKILR